MAIRAILSELVFMDVFVAGHTIAGLHTRPVLKNSRRGSVNIVAFAAVYLLVFSF